MLKPARSRSSILLDPITSAGFNVMHPDQTETRDHHPADGAQIVVMREDTEPERIDIGMDITIPSERGGSSKGKEKVTDSDEEAEASPSTEESKDHEPLKSLSDHYEDWKYRILRIAYAIQKLLIFNTHLLCYFLMVINCTYYASLTALVFPLSLFVCAPFPFRDFSRD